MDSSNGSAAALNPIERWLAQRPRLVLDGALGSELARRGADLNDPLWSARLLRDQPELIRAVHLDYYRAGADVATTASYQASFEGFARAEIDHAATVRLLRLSVELAQQARDAYWAELSEAERAERPRPLVAASIGPYGAMLADGSEYRGDYGLTEDELMAFHRPRLQVLAEAGADLLACETIPCIAEARALARLLAERPGIWAWLSFSCRDGAHDSQGEPWAECVTAVAGFAEVAAIGINCTAPQHVAQLVETARTLTAKPIVVYPNKGEHYDASTKQWQGADGLHGTFADQAMRWAAAGAGLIGGCCRTTPEDIVALARRWATVGGSVR